MTKNLYAVDFHTHSTEGSHCSPETLHDMAEAAVKYGLDAMALSNHEVYLPDELVNEARADFPQLKLYNSIEVDCGGEHIVCIGTPQRKFFAEKWDRSWKTLVTYMHGCGNAVILAHPYRFTNELGIDLNEALPDAVELHSLHTMACVEKQIRELGKKYGLKFFGSSDAHHKGKVGIYHGLFSTLPADETEAAQLVRSSEAPVIEGDKARIEEHNAGIEADEKIISEYIAEGGTPEGYEKKFNRWRGAFDCVAAGKSYKI